MEALEFSAASKELIVFLSQWEPTCPIPISIFAKESGSFRDPFELLEREARRHALEHLSATETIKYDSEKGFVSLNDPASANSDLEAKLFASEEERLEWHKKLLLFLTNVYPAIGYQNLSLKLCIQLLPHGNVFINRIGTTLNDDEDCLEALIRLILFMAHHTLTMCDDTLSEVLLNKARKLYEQAAQPIKDQVHAYLKDVEGIWNLEVRDNFSAAAASFKAAAEWKSQRPKQFAIREVAFSKNYEAATFLANEQLDEATKQAESVIKLLTGEGEDVEEGNLDEQGDVYAHSLHLMGNAKLMYSEFDQAERLYTKAFIVRSRVLGREHPTTQRTVMNLADIIKHTRSPSEAEELICESRRILETELGPEHELSLHCLRALADVACAQKRFEEAEEYLKLAVERGKSRYGVHTPPVLSTLRSLNRLYLTTGNFEALRALVKEQEECARTFYDSDHPRLAATLVDVCAAMIDALGMFDEAIDKGTEALRILEKVYGKESEQAASALNVLASCYYYKDDLAKAEALFRARLRLLNETHPDYVTTLSNIANVFERLDRLREAEDLHRRALRQLEERSNSPTTFVGIELEIASCLCGLAAVLMKQHKNVEAEAALTRALELYSKNLPDHHVLIGGTILKLAHLFAVDGRLNEGERACRKAAEIFIQNFGVNAPETQDASTMLQIILREKERRQSAADSDAAQPTAAPRPVHTSVYARKVKGRAAGNTTTRTILLGTGAAVMIAGIAAVIGYFVRKNIVQRNE